MIATLTRRIPDARARFTRFSRFGAVGLSGFVVNELALALFAGVFGLDYLLGAILATQVSTTWNFALVEVWAFRDHTARHPWTRRAGLFFAMNNAALLLRGPIIVGLTDGLGVNYLVSNLVSLGVLTVLRFVLADNWIWAGSPIRAVPEEVGVL